MYICIYVYVCTIYTYVCIYIYIYIYPVALIQALFSTAIFPHKDSAFL